MLTIKRNGTSFTQDYTWKNHNDMFEQVEIPGLPTGVRLQLPSEPEHIPIRNGQNRPYNMTHICKLERTVKYALLSK